MEQNGRAYRHAHLLAMLMISYAGARVNETNVFDDEHVPNAPFYTDRRSDRRTFVDRRTFIDRRTYYNVDGVAVAIVVCVCAIAFSVMAYIRGCVQVATAVLTVSLFI